MTSKYRIITLSGHSYTGTTTVAELLSDILNWKFVSAGNRFREFCRERDLPITLIPHEVQLQFDETIIKEISELEKTVMEGRYLGYFGRDLNDTLKILLEANKTVRAYRCLNRENDISTIQQAIDHIDYRDSREKDDAYSLYGIRDFLNHSFFDLIMENSSKEHLDKTIDIILNKGRWNVHY